MFEAFDFTEEELLANRAGKLSPRQDEWLEEYLGLAKKRGRFAVIVGMGSVVLPFGVAFFAQPNQFLQSLPYLSIAAALYLSIFSAFVIVDYNKLRRLNAREVQSVDGIVQLSSKKLGRRGWTAYYVAMEKIRFQIHRDQYEKFQDGARFCVYFLQYPPTHWFLSIEQR